MRVGQQKKGSIEFREMFSSAVESSLLTREHREPALTDWNVTLWVYRVT